MSTIQNVVDFGALGDSMHDDTPAIQAAITAAQSFPRGAAVYFPATRSGGAYRTTSPLMVTGNQIRLYGDLFAASNLFKDHAGDALQLTGSNYASRISYITIEDLRFIAITSGGAAINALYTERTRLRRVYVEASSMGAKFATGLQFVDCNFPQIANCQVESCTGNGIEILGEQNASGNLTFNAELETVYVSANGVNGVVLANCRSSRLSNVSANDNGGRGIDIEGSASGTRHDGMWITNCECDSNADIGLYVAYCRFVFISNLWASSGRTNLVAGVSIQHSHMVSIAGAIAYWCGQYGFFFSDVTELSGSGLMSDRCPSYGIVIDAGCSKVRLQAFLDSLGNTLNPEGAAPPYGLYVDTTTTDIVIEREGLGLSNSEGPGSARPAGQTSATTTVAYTLTALDGTVRADATSGATTVTLPAAASVVHRIYTIKKIDSSAHAVTVAAAGSDLIDGASTVVISAQYVALTIQSNGASWDIL